MVACPPTPEWKRLDLNGEAVLDDDDDGVPSSPVHVCGVLENVLLFCSLIFDILFWAFFTLPPFYIHN